MRVLYVCYSNNPLPSNIVSNGAYDVVPLPLWNYALWQVISVLGMSLEQVIPPRMLSTRRDCTCSASRHLAYDVSFYSFSPFWYMLRLSQQTTHTFLAHCRHLEPGGLPIQIANSSVLCVACIFSRRRSQAAQQMHWHSYSRVPWRLGAVEKPAGHWGDIGQGDFTCPLTLALIRCSTMLVQVTLARAQCTVAFAVTPGASTRSHAVCVPQHIIPHGVTPPVSVLPSSI